ncbi:hypothetical protein D3C71_2212110 [compost metagenome]
MGNGRNQLQIEGNGLANPLHFLQQGRRGAKDACQRTETFKQCLGDRFGIATRNQPEE